jgi:hypothetical protein
MKSFSINIIVLVIAAVVVGGGAFFGGMAYAKATKPAVNSIGLRQGTALGNGNMMRFVGAAGAGGGRMANGGFTAGSVVATSANGFTVSLPNGGGSKVIIVASSTSIGKISQGSLQDVSDGSNVIVTGTANSDGSITASTVQIRPEGEAIPEFGGLRGQREEGGQPAQGNTTSGSGIQTP